MWSALDAGDTIRDSDMGFTLEEYKGGDFLKCFEKEEGYYLVEKVRTG